MKVACHAGSGSVNVSGGSLTLSYMGINGTTYSSATAPTNAGTYTVTTTYAGDNNHYGSNASAALTITPKLLGSKPGFVVLYRHSFHLADESRDIGRHSAAGENAGLKTYLEVRFFVHVDAVDESHLACAARHHQ